MNDHRLSLTLQLRGQSFEVFFECRDAAMALSAEVRLMLELLPAMRDGRPIAAGAIDARLAGNLPAIVAIYAAWVARLSTIEVSHGIRSDSAGTNAGRRVATFFSGGLDSFYTLLKHQDQITDLILVHGFDMALQDRPLQDLVSASLREVARKTGKNLIEVRTNLRALFDQTLPWDFSHGAALAIIGQLLTQHFSTIYIPASDHYAGTHVPWGSHPVLDPLWSTRTLQFIHDGCEANRVEKAHRIATSEVALQHLRVCYENRDGLYNCGVCRKCTHTMVSLVIADCLSGCSTFPAPLELPMIRRHVYRSDLSFLTDNMQALAVRDRHPELLYELRRAHAIARLSLATRNFRLALRAVWREMGETLRAWYRKSRAAR